MHWLVIPVHVAGAVAMAPGRRVFELLQYKLLDYISWKIPQTLEHQTSVVLI
jgi:hypothetical protein